MRRRFLSGLFISALCILAATPAYAVGWVTQTSGTSAMLNDVALIGSTAYAVGNSGTILRSTDTGRTWTSTPAAGISAGLRGVDTGAWIVGGSGTRLVGGPTWENRSSSSTFPTYYDVFQFFSGHALVVGGSVGSGLIQITVNGGASWSNAVIPDGTPPLYAIDCVDVDENTPHRCFAVGDNGTILRSLDAGSTWTTLASSTSADLYGVTAVSPTVIYAVGDGGVVRRTTNAGGIWSNPVSGGGVLGGGVNLRDVEYQTILGVFAVGENDNVYQSPDGNTWSTSLVGGRPASLQGIEFTSAGGIVVGANGTIALYDATPPSIPLNIQKTTPGNDTTPTFTWTASTDAIGPIIYETSLDGGAWEAGSFDAATTISPALTQGAHTLQVRAVDGATNRSAASSVFSFTIDTTVPTRPTGLVRTTVDTDSTPTFTWSASTDTVGVSHYSIELRAGTGDSGAAMVLNPNIGNVLTYTVPDANVLAIGTYTFLVQAKDAAGNFSAAAGATFTITASTSGGGTSGGGTSGGGTTGGGTTGGGTSGGGSSGGGTSGGGTTGGGTSGGTSGGSTSGGTSNSTPSGPPFTLAQMEADAGVILQGNMVTLLAHLGYSNSSMCQMSETESKARVDRVFVPGTIENPSVRNAIVNFTACGTPTTLHLGGGERLGVVNSYRAAFARLPLTTAHWFDVMKIANGRFPGETSASAEAAAKTRFARIYLRAANMGQQNDSAAVNVMAYGLRPLPRNLSSEAAAIAIFRGIFRYSPTSAIDWDAVRAIAYSGAQR